MRLFPPPVEIGEHEGFAPEKDIFGRAEIGRGLTNVLTAVTEPLVVAVDAQWGSGKTTFLKMWSGELRKIGVPVIYFDAYENDYTEDAFTALAGELIALAEQKGHSRAKTFLEKAKGAGKLLLRSSLKLGMKAATLGALEAADIGDVTEELAKEVSEVEDKYLGELLTKQKQNKDTIQEFRRALADLPDLLRDPSDSTPKPLVLIIDELDRCRPLFALEILERIKHFFSVRRVHFVLGTHMDQLRNSVVMAYGPKIDASTYLQKFIHLTVYLVDAAKFDHERIIPKFIGYLERSLQFEPKHADLVLGTKAILRHIAEANNLSLRTIERIMTTLAIALAGKGDSTFCPAAFLAGLCILKITDPELYVKARTGQLIFDEVRKPFALSVETRQGDKRHVEHFGQMWGFAIGLNPTQDMPKEVPQLSQMLANYDFHDRSELVPFVATVVVDRFNLTNREPS